MGCLPGINAKTEDKEKHPEHVFFYCVLPLRLILYRCQRRVMQEGVRFVGSFSNDTMAHPQGDLICDKNNINLLFRSSSKFCKFWIFEHRLPPSCLKLMTSWKLKARERLMANIRVPEVSVSTARFCSEPTLCAPSDRKGLLRATVLPRPRAGAAHGAAWT